MEFVKFIEKEISLRNFSPAMVVALRLVKENRFDPITLKKCVGEFGLDVLDIKSESLLFYVDYARHILIDDHVDENEMITAKRLKLLFKIHEGDFFEGDFKNLIKAIIQEQSEKFYCDNIVDDRESIAKVHLQELFDLSYDQYLEMEHEAVESALKRGANSHDLDTYYKL